MHTPVPRSLNVSLWIAQSIVAFFFVFAGIWKLLTPRDALASMIPWAGDVPPAFLYATAFFDLAGGVGILLPALTRVAPRLGVAAALGCALLQTSAFVFHASRGELAATPFNFFLAGLSFFVLWGRGVRAPIASR